MKAIVEVLEELKTATVPVARAIHKGSHFKVLILGFNKGMIMKDHQTHLSTKLTVLSGSVYYIENGHETLANQYDEIEIPVDITHSVKAIEDSLCLLTQGS